MTESQISKCAATVVPIFYVLQNKETTMFPPRKDCVSLKPDVPTFRLRTKTKWAVGSEKKNKPIDTYWSVHMVSNTSSKLLYIHL